MTNEQLFNIVKKKGECWHMWKFLGHGQVICTKCGTELCILQSGDCRNPDFATWEGFGWLWQRAAEKAWWDSFRKACFYQGGYAKYIQPTRFRNALKEFLEWESD